MDYLNYSEFNSLIAFFGGGLLFIGLLFLAFIIVVIVANWKLFKKAGRKGWESIIPFYNSWVLVEIAGLNWWWFFLLIINLTFTLKVDVFSFTFNLFGFIANFNCYYNIARRFGKDKTTSIFAGIFSFIFVLMFAFAKKEVYDASIPVSANGIFSSQDDDNIVNTDGNYHDSEDIQSTDIVDKDELIDENNTKKKTDNKENNVREYSFCSNCGTKLNKDMKFCPDCGKKKI